MTIFLSVAHIAGLAQARSLLPLSPAAAESAQVPAGAPLPGQGDVRHIHCLICITFPLKAASQQAQ